MAESLSAEASLLELVFKATGDFIEDWTKSAKSSLEGEAREFLRAESYFSSFGEDTSSSLSVSLTDETLKGFREEKSGLILTIL